MKKINTSVLVLLAGSSLLPAATPKTLSPERVPDPLIQEAPYRFNGVVYDETGRGSGFCAWDKKAFFSAAHVVFDNDKGEWNPPPLWNPAANSISLDKSNSIQTRGYFHWTSYGVQAMTPGADNNAFSQDVILGFAFRNLIQDSPAVLNLNGASDLQRSISSLITGYPVENAYTGEHFGGYFMYKTGPTVRIYEPLAGRALDTTLITTGHGNSGGPIWTKDPVKGWSAAGVLVGGLPSETTVYAFSKDVNYLTRAASLVVKSSPAQSTLVPGVAEYSRFSSYGRDTEIPDGVHQWTTFSLPVNGFDPTTVVLNVRLSMNITTTHRGDLQVMLVSPDGVQQVVHNEEGADKDNLILNSKDYSETFKDIVADGTWQLRVQDRLVEDIATVRSILLEIVPKRDPITAP